MKKIQNDEIYVPTFEMSICPTISVRDIRSRRFYISRGEQFYYEDFCDKIKDRLNE